MPSCLFDQENAFNLCIYFITYPINKFSLILVPGQLSNIWESMLKIYVIILLSSSLAIHGEVQQTKTKKFCSVIGMCKVSTWHAWKISLMIQSFVNLFQGMLTGSYIKQSKDECLSFCNEVCIETVDGPCIPSCEWFSFNQNQKVCLHFNSCPELDETFTEYISGQKECYQEPTCKLWIRQHPLFMNINS